MSEERKEQSKEGKGEGGERREQPVTLLEKIATTLSALLVAALVVVLVRDAQRPDAPPRFSVDVGTIAVTGPRFHVPVTVHNLGDKSAKSVVVHLELVIARNDSVAAESDVEIDWLPGQSSRDVMGVFASSSAENATVRADVRGYAVP
jgi:uncharacterized protein (TIGR02588 family)